MGTIISRFIAQAIGVMSVPYMATASLIRADEAVPAFRRGEVMIIDVRTLTELRQTGIPEGSKPPM